MKSLLHVHFAPQASPMLHWGQANWPHVNHRDIEAETEAKAIRLGVSAKRYAVGASKAKNTADLCQTGARP